MDFQVFVVIMAVVTQYVWNTGLAFWGVFLTLALASIYVISVRPYAKRKECPLPSLLYPTQKSRGLILCCGNTSFKFRKVQHCLTFEKQRSGQSQAAHRHA